MSYQPRPGSIAAHVCAWFKANPARKLTTAEICGRFGGTSTKLAAELGAAEDADYLLSEYLGRSNVYSAGPKLAGWTPSPSDLDMPAAPPPAPAPAPAMATAPAATGKKLRKRRDLPAVEALQIDSGVPIPPATTGRAAAGRFDKLFGRMKPGDSVALSTEQAKPLFDAAVRWAKRTGKPNATPKFALRRLDESTSRLWRTE